MGSFLNRHEKDHEMRGLCFLISSLILSLTLMFEKKTAAILRGHHLFMICKVYRIPILVGPRFFGGDCDVIPGMRSFREHLFEQITTIYEGVGSMVCRSQQHSAVSSGEPRVV